MTAGGRYHLPAGSSQAGQFELEVTPATSGWTYASLRVLSLDAGRDGQHRDRARGDAGGPAVG